MWDTWRWYRMILENEYVLRYHVLVTTISFGPIWDVFIWLLMTPAAIKSASLAQLVERRSHILNMKQWVTAAAILRSWVRASQGALNDILLAFFKSYRGFFSSLKMNQEFIWQGRRKFRWLLDNDFFCFLFEKKSICVQHARMWGKQPRSH
jgi:hypothetical protein